MQCVEARELAIGDQFFDPDGDPSEVIAFPRGLRPVDGEMVPALLYTTLDGLIVAQSLPLNARVERISND